MPHLDPVQGPDLVLGQGDLDLVDLRLVEVMRRAVPRRVDPRLADPRPVELGVRVELMRPAGRAVLCDRPHRPGLTLNGPSDSLGAMLLPDAGAPGTKTAKPFSGKRPHGYQNTHYRDVRR